MKMLKNIKYDDIRAIIFPKTFNEEYSYLGYTYIPYKENSEPYNLVIDFFKEVEKKVRPKYCPKFFLRFLELFGNDNSVSRVRNWWLHNLFNKITRNYRIDDCKTKWCDSDIRIYGRFDKELYDKLYILEEKIDKYYKNEKC